MHHLSTLQQFWVLQYCIFIWDVNDHNKLWSYCNCWYMLKKEKNTFNWGLKDFFKLFKIKNENNYLVVLEKNELFDRKNKNDGSHSCGYWEIWTSQKSQAGRNIFLVVSWQADSSAAWSPPPPSLPVSWRCCRRSCLNTGTEKKQRKIHQMYYSICYLENSDKHADSRYVLQVEMCDIQTLRLLDMKWECSICRLYVC